MAQEFQCDSFEDLVFTVDDITFKYSDCDVMSEVEHTRFPTVELVLKSPCGNFAEVIVVSHDSATGKENIVRGKYEGIMIEEGVAKSLVKLAVERRNR